MFAFTAVSDKANLGSAGKKAPDSISPCLTTCPGVILRTNFLPSTYVTPFSVNLTKSGSEYLAI